MLYTIEARQLTSEARRRPASLTEPRRTRIEAADEDEAISRFIHDSESELVSFQSLHGRESIATVKKDDSVFLVRVYAG